MTKIYIRYIFLLGILLCASLYYAQEADTLKSQGEGLPTQVVDSTRPRSRTRIVIENADRISNDENRAPGLQVLTGDVCFRHGNTYMTCDSAHYRRDNNSFYAMGRVHVNEGDTLTLDCDRMDYLGDRELIKAYGNVRLVNKTTELTTDTLDYDRIEQRAYYNHFATIRDGNNTLSSRIGIYTVPEDMTDFYMNVEAKNPEFEMYGDTLHYGTVSKVITIQGPTYIISDENRIYTEHGVYDTTTEISDFTQNTRVYYGNNRMITGDKIHYERYEGYARVEDNVVIRDTSRRVMIAGEVAEYFEKLDSAVVPVRPRVVMFGRDTLFLRADVIEMVPLKDTVDKKQEERSAMISMLTGDSSGEEEEMPVPLKDDADTTSSEPWQLGGDDEFFQGDGAPYARGKMSNDRRPDNHNMPRVMRAFGNVRYYKHDMSGFTDSIAYNQHTGIMTMYREPAVFSRQNQITGDTIEVKQNATRELTDSVVIYSNAFIISQDARNPLQYNQISGKYIRGKIIDDDLRRVFITGNAQVLYYTYDGDGNSVGLNLSKASRMMVMMRRSMVERIRFIKSPDGQIMDLSSVPEEMRELKGFRLRMDEAPHNAEEIWGKDPYDVRLEIDY
ncbi:MAG: hypothetical protein IIY15_06140 [Flavobacteriales bacterium]|nr:hypothetical protein [Flavobacteriales bacterium]